MGRMNCPQDGSQKISHASLRVCTHLTSSTPMSPPNQAVVFEYDLLAVSASNQAPNAAGINGGSNGSSSNAGGRRDGVVNATSNASGFQSLTPSTENLVDEVSGLLGKARKAAGLGSDSLQDMGRTLMAGLKDNMRSPKALDGGAREPSSLMKKPSYQEEPKHAQDLDPKAKYMDKVCRPCELYT